MKPLLIAAALLVALHLLAAAGFAAWLYQTGRIDEARLREAVALFEKPIDQARAEADRAQREAEQQAQQLREDEFLEQVAQGPATLDEQLQETNQDTQISRAQHARIVREIRDLQRQTERARAVLAQQRQQLEADRAAFEQRIREQTGDIADEEFQQTVDLYNKLDPGQVKAMFTRLIDDGQTEMVVRYLAAMQQRAATAVISEFEGEQEIARAVDLLERLRTQDLRPLIEGLGDYTGPAARADPTDSGAVAQGAMP